jgi:hypothetical protein
VIGDEADGPATDMDGCLSATRDRHLQRARVTVAVGNFNSLFGYVLGSKYSLFVYTIRKTRIVDRNCLCVRCSVQKRLGANAAGIRRGNYKKKSSR